MDEWFELIKKLLGIPEDDTSKDEAIRFYMSVALPLIQQATGRLFVHGIYQDTIPNPGAIVYLTEFPVLDVDEVKFGDNGNEIDPTEYVFNPMNGRITFSRGDCRCFYPTCCELPLVVVYEANGGLPPPWVSLAVADAVRAALAMTEVQNEYGFLAKKVSVTDVGSVELSTGGESPAHALEATLAQSLQAYTPPSFAASSSCCSGYQTSELLQEVTP